MLRDEGQRRNILNYLRSFDHFIISTGWETREVKEEDIRYKSLRNSSSIPIPSSSLNDKRLKYLLSLLTSLITLIQFILFLLASNLLIYCNIWFSSCICFSCLLSTKVIYACGWESYGRKACVFASIWIKALNK